MLHDVWYLMRLPVEGRIVTDQTILEDLKCNVAEHLGMPIENLNKDQQGHDSPHYCSGGVPIDSVDSLCTRRLPTPSEET